MRKRNVDILNGNISKQLLLFFFPVFAGYIIQQTYSFADSIILGKLVSKQALAAVGGSPNAIITIITNLISGISSAIMVRIALNYGKGAFDKVNDVIKSAIFLCVILAGSLTIVLFFSAKYLLILMQAPLDTYDLSLIYLKIYSLCLIPLFIYNVGLSMMRGLGDSRKPIYLIILTAIVKIGFDLLFVGTFSLGVIGVAIATIISHSISALAIMLILHFSTDVIHHSIKDFGYDKEELQNIIKIGIPFSIQSMAFAIPNTLIQAKINSFGTDAVAAYYTFSNADSLFWCFNNALGIASTTMISQNYGNKNYKRVKSIFLYSILYEALGCILFGVFFHFFAHEVIGMFSSDPTVIEMGKIMILITSRLYLLYVMAEAVNSFCKAVGKAKAPMFIAMVTILLTRILYLLFIPQKTFIYPIFSFPITWAFTSISYSVYYLNSCRIKENN